jgi:hypothetical protein
MQTTVAITIAAMITTNAQTADGENALDHFRDTVLPTYNIVWNSPSKDASESMPCGGHDIGLNVWVEHGDVLFYIARSGALAENNEFLKLGRVRLRLEPNPFAMADASFRQELKLREGCVEISAAGEGVPKTLVRIWVETHRPIIHVDVEADQPINATAAYENWRIEDEWLAKGLRRHSTFNLNAYPGDIKLSADHIAHDGDGVLFYHRNPDADRLLPDLLIKQQGLEAFRDQITDDLQGRTFGGRLIGEGFTTAAITEGRYQTKDYKAWSIRSKAPAKSLKLRVVTHIAQTETLDDWLIALSRLAEASSRDRAEARDKTLAWWDAFWQRSWIAIHPQTPGQADPNSRPWRVARNYNLFRYQLGCNAFGEYPSKFNGGSFTFDANLVGKKWAALGPDFRQWGGGVFTAQNQRLLYWPMLKAGDFDAILPQFELYRKALPGAKARVRAHFDHDGAVYSEYIGAPGIAAGMGYGWASGRRVRGEEVPLGDPRADPAPEYGEPVEKGIMANRAISLHWESQVEHAYMMLEYARFNGTDISQYLPFIENAVVFFDAHYRKRQKLRTGKELDDNGQLVIYPSKACESFRGATNPADLIAGLHACIDRIVEMDDSALELRDKAFYRRLKETLPPYSYGRTKGKRVIKPAKSWTEYGNAELPMLYPLFPFNRFALGRDDMQVFIDTYQLGEFRKGNIISWHQDGIFFARMGMTDAAADFNSRKLDDAPRRFPTFWGPGHDWVPDHNWGGSGMIGLQEMLMQTIGDEIRLLPAWPADWDVDFRLHAPQQTVVTGRVRNGEIVSLEVTPESRRKDVVVHGNDEDK